jgi:hypothetical protein
LLLVKTKSVETCLGAWQHSSSISILPETAATFYLTFRPASSLHEPVFSSSSIKQDPIAKKEI